MLIKIKMFIRRIKKNIKIYWGLPHVKVLIVIVFLAVLSLEISIFCENSDQKYNSSLFANIFAGLLTGVVLSIFSSVKTISLYRTEKIIEWLNSVHSNYLEWNTMSRKILFYKEDSFKNKEELYDYVYDVLSYGDGINVMISQARFDDSLPFNSYKYVKKHMDYDAVIYKKKNDELRDWIMATDISNLTECEIRKLFKEMQHSLFLLNGSIMKKINELETKKNALNTF